MNIKDFLFKLFGFSKPTIIQMIIRKIEIFYDKIYGLDFLSVIPLKELGLDDSVVVQGSPSGNKYLYNLLKDLDIKEHNSILDIGCAKGSAIKYFSKFPFKKIDGLELSKTLTKICDNNFRILNISNIKVHNISATEFKGYNDYNFFYLYNPFPEIVMIKFIDCLKKQILSKPITIIYNNPVCHNVLINNGFLLLKKYPDMWGNGINVYSNVVKSNKNLE